MGVSRAAEWSSELVWEIIVVDDASPDGTQEVAQELAKVYGEDKIVRVLSCSWCHVAERAAGSETTSREARAWVRMFAFFTLIRRLIVGVQDCVYPWT